MLEYISDSGSREQPRSRAQDPGPTLEQLITVRTRRRDPLGDKNNRSRLSLFRVKKSRHFRARIGWASSQPEAPWRPVLTRRHSERKPRAPRPYCGYRRLHVRPGEALVPVRTPWMEVHRDHTGRGSVVRRVRQFTGRHRYAGWSARERTPFRQAFKVGSIASQIARRRGVNRAPGRRPCWPAPELRSVST